MELRKLLQEKGFRMTSQREAVLRAIQSCKGKHLTAEEIYEQTREISPDIGIATVYRTLQLLTELGMITKDYLGDDTVRYEQSHEPQSHTHHHLVCLACGRILEAQEDLMQVIEQLIQDRYRFEIVDHRIQFLGYCEKCSHLGKTDESWEKNAETRSE